MTVGLSGSVAALTGMVPGITRTMPGFAGTATGLPLSSAETEHLIERSRKYFNSHIYSMAPEAKRKLQYDMQVAGRDYAHMNEVSLDNERYLKGLIRFASRGKPVVRSDATGLQFFIIEGGGEGFLLSPIMRSLDANDYAGRGTTTSGRKEMIHWEQNNILMAFKADGNLIYAALLNRPLAVPGKDGISRESAELVWQSWDDRSVFIYRNQNIERGWIPYLGLGVDDPYRYLPYPHNIVIDMHKVEYTNGCIFIVDPKTPPKTDPAILAWEPQLIVRVLAAVGKSPKDISDTHVPLGRLRKIRIMNSERS